MHNAFSRKKFVARWEGEVKRLADLTQHEIALWQQLAAACPELRSPFFSFEFARVVAEAGALARICILYEHGRLAGFFPFQFSGRIAQSMAAAERLGGALSDFCGVIIDGSRHGPIGNRDLLRCAGLACLDIGHLDGTQTCLGLTASVRTDGARIRLDSGGQERYWARLKSAHPSDYGVLARRERKAQRESRSIDFVFAYEEPEKLLPCVVAEKRRQYSRTGKSDGLAQPWKRRCLDLIAREREGRCVPVVSALYLDGCWAALHFGIRARNVLHYYLPVYNPRFRNFSPGLILLAKMIRAAPDHGIEEIDLGEGLSRYKEVFATETYPVYRDLWYRANLRGFAYRGYSSVAWRVQRLGERSNLGLISNFG